jgi:hypothetical protein
MEITPLDYKKPNAKKPYSTAAFISLAASAISGPLGAQSEQFSAIPEAVFWTIRFLPLGIAVLFGCWTFHRLGVMRHRYRGRWLVGLSCGFDLFWLLCLLSPPI